MDTLKNIIPDNIKNTKQPTKEDLSQFAWDNSYMIQLAVMTVVIYFLTFHISPRISEIFKRGGFFIMFTIFIVSAYSAVFFKVSKQDNIVREIEITTKEIADYISSGKYKIKYNNLDEFVTKLMDDNKYIYGMWINLTDKKEMKIFSYRNNARMLTMILDLKNQPDNLKAFRKLDWTNKAKKLKEDITKSGVVYDRGVWIDPFIEDKISKSLLIPCIYPVVINNEYKGFVASCLTVYSNDYI